MGCYGFPVYYLSGSLCPSSLLLWGGDHGSASLIKQCVRGLLCGTGKDAIINYMLAWRGALCRLDGTPWDFMAFDCIQTFVDNLPISDTYCSLHEWVDNGFSVVPPLFPDFEDIATAALNIDVQQH